MRRYGRHWREVRRPSVVAHRRLRRRPQHVCSSPVPALRHYASTPRLSPGWKPATGIAQSRRSQLHQPRFMALQPMPARLASPAHVAQQSPRRQPRHQRSRSSRYNIYIPHAMTPTVGTRRIYDVIEECLQARRNIPRFLPPRKPAAVHTASTPAPSCPPPVAQRPRPTSTPPFAASSACHRDSAEPPRGGERATGKVPGGGWEGRKVLSEAPRERFTTPRSMLIAGKWQRQREGTERRPCVRRVQAQQRACCAQEMEEPRGRGVAGENCMPAGVCDRDRWREDSRSAWWRTARCRSQASSRRVGTMPRTVQTNSARKARKRLRAHGRRKHRTSPTNGVRIPVHTINAEYLREGAQWRPPAETPM